jgi:hypothetical protein
LGVMDGQEFGFGQRRGPQWFGACLPIQSNGYRREKTQFGE